MKMKIVVIFICILLISVALPVTGLIENNKIESIDINLKDINTEKQYEITQNTINDTIDQFQTENGGSGVAIYNETMYAQSFIPSLGILTRVQLFLFREGNPSNDIEITVSIKQSLYKRDIASKSINGSQISEQGEWIEFDLYYIDLIPGNIYYIVCTTSGGTKTDHFSWYFNVHNQYVGGDTQFSENYGADWFPFVLTGFPHIDFCFITYGYENFAPNKPVKPDGEIKGYYSKPYSYQTISADADNDEMFYFWDWGDGSTSDWIGPNISGDVCVASHTWMEKGSYLVKVKAKDKWGVESDWSDSLTIRMEKEKSKNLYLSDLFSMTEYDFRINNSNFFNVNFLINCLFFDKS